MRLFGTLAIFLFSFLSALSQGKDRLSGGIIMGNLLDSSSQKAVPGATIRLQFLQDSTRKFEILSDKKGIFSFSDLPFGYYRLTISSIGYAGLSIDSIHIREERFDFNLADIGLVISSRELETVVVYAEKPLIQSKDGNITFNTGESALAAGSNAGELLNHVPLVTKDPNGKILVRGKEPKILIDDKPVELNLQQLQDLLESLPGSSIEKIEVMTNPPPQYANEQGGVINIVTKKGKVGMGGRLSVSAGTRGEGSVNGNFNYRKNKFAINVNAGAGTNRSEGFGWSSRRNIYTDSANHFNTKNNYLNKSVRPNMRVNMDYDFSKTQSLNFVAHYNQNDFNNRNSTEYTHINQYDEIYKLSERNIGSEGISHNSNMNITYTRRGKRPGEQLRIITGSSFSTHQNDRTFYQQYFNPDHTPNGFDSTQQQLTDNRSNGYQVRMNFDKPFSNKKTFLSMGTAYNRSNSHVEVDARYRKKPEGTFENLDLLTNHFRFYQDVVQFRFSVRQLVVENFSVTAGVSAEATRIGFDLLNEDREVSNDYRSFLPFANINKSWKNQMNLTLAYRRTIRRPGINELNPTIDFSDPYNVRFGNYQLDPSLAHNFDLVIGRTRTKFFSNIGVGYNVVEDIFSQVRTLLEDGKTQVTWENISNRKEFEISTWNGYTVSKKVKINWSASYVYNEYSEYDRRVRKFRNGGSFTSTLNGNYSVKDIWNFNGNFTTNRFANAQGSVNWNLSMNVGVQKKFFEKRFIVTFNLIDPFRNQQTKTFTYGKNFELQSYNTTETKNYRLTLAYQFIKGKR